MSSNDISPCLMTQQDPLKSDERCNETKSGKSLLENKIQLFKVTKQKQPPLQTDLSS